MLVILLSLFSIWVSHLQMLNIPDSIQINSKYLLWRCWAIEPILYTKDQFGESCLLSQLILLKLNHYPVSRVDYFDK